MPANRMPLYFPAARGSRYRSLSTGCRLWASRFSPLEFVERCAKGGVVERPSARRSYIDRRDVARSLRRFLFRGTGESFNGVRRRRISDFQSGIFCLGDAIDSGYKFAPSTKLRSEDLAALTSQTIVAAPALSIFFDPTSRQPAAMFESVEQGIERSNVKTNCAVRACSMSLLIS